MIAFRRLALGAPGGRGRPGGSYGASSRHADPAGHARIGVTLVDTPVDQMALQTAQAYMIGIQEELIAHGYRPGQVDGAMEPQTRSAIRVYQRDAGLAVDGVVTKELLDHLKFAQSKVFASTSSGGDLDPVLVRDIQVDAKVPVTGEINQALLEQLRNAAPDSRASSST